MIVLSIFNDDLIARAIAAAAHERRWNDIEAIMEQYGRLTAASEELRPLVQDYVDADVMRALRENDEVDILLERWAALMAEIPANGEVRDDLMEQCFRLARDGRAMLRNLETDLAIRRMDDMDRQMKAHDVPGVRPDAT